MPIINIDFLKTPKFYLKQLLGNHTTLWGVTYNLRPSYNKQAVDRKTDLVIEGFPRTANSFATLAFQYSQPTEIRIAHHHHVPAQVIRGVQLDLPVLVLIRHPLDTVTSLKIRHPSISIASGLRTYSWYYERIEDVKSNILLADFANVTKTSIKLSRE